MQPTVSFAFGLKPFLVLSYFVRSVRDALVIDLARHTWVCVKRYPQGVSLTVHIAALSKKGLEPPLRLPLVPIASAQHSYLGSPPSIDVTSKISCR